MLDEDRQVSSASVRQLRNRCVLALVAVTAIIVFTQVFAFFQLRRMNGDAELVNVAGRQRMISQRLPRLAQNVLFSNDGAQRDEARRDARALLREFTTSQELIQERVAGRSGKEYSSKSPALLEEMAPAFESIVFRMENLSMPEPQDIAIQLAARESDYAALGEAADQFLPVMDQLVKEFELEANGRLTLSRAVQVASAVLIVALLSGVLIGILTPAMHHIRLAMHEHQRASESKSEFLANMSHEIRTPMTAILGFTDILLSRVKEPESVDAARTVKENGQHLLHLINDILDLSKIESGKISVELESISPQQLVGEVASLMRVRAKAKGLPLEITFDGAIPESVQSDSTRLRQILINLVGNAIKFTETGSVRLETRLLAATEPEPKLQFDVVDTGIGIPEAMVERVFEPFTQADGSTTRTFGGTGLGLSISRRLATLLGGELTVTSSVGEGSTFTVTIATGSLDGVRLINGLTEPQASERSSQQQNRARQALAGLRILLAEDGPDNQRLVSFLLRKAGAEVAVANNGQECMELALEAHSEGRSFDLIFMDMQMPVLGGYDATRRLREEGYDLPIVALTAHAMSTDRQKCLDAGCNDYATKPVDREVLVEKVLCNIGSEWRQVSKGTSD